MGSMEEHPATSDSSVQHLARHPTLHPSPHHPSTSAGFRTMGSMEDAGLKVSAAKVNPALEATQGQMDDFLSQLPHKCHLEELVSVGN